MKKSDTIKLLAIDDQPDNLTALTIVVQKALPQTLVLTATNGLDGIELAAAEDPDVILLDIVMPGMDGFELCRRLKADDRIKDIPVVFLTALMVDTAGRVKALEAGSEGFLTKPLETTDLIAQIRAMTKVKAANRSQRTEKERLEALVAERTRMLGLELTERKQAEEALRESEERFRVLLENIETVAVQGYGLDGTVQYWNKGSERLYGYRQQEALGCNLLDLIIPSQMKDDVAKEMLTMAESGQPVPAAELLLMHKDGSRVPVISSHTIVRVPGRAHELFCLDVGITERKRAEEALLQADEILKTMQMGLYVYELENPADDSSLRMVAANAASGKLSGVSPDELIGKYIDEIFPALRTLGLPKRFADIVRTGKASEFEDFYYADDRVLQTAFAVKAFPLPNHRVGITFDSITERKQAEESLLASEEKFRSIFASMTEMVVLHELVCDEEGRPVNYRILDCNPAFTQITGIRRDDAVGQLATDVYGSDTAPYLDEFSHVALTGEPCTFITSYAPMDKHFDVHLASPEKNRFVTVTTDITERKQAEKVLEHQRKTYEQILEHSLAGYWDWDIPTGDEYLSLIFKKMFG